jgi:hypothetical protein
MGEKMNQTEVIPRWRAQGALNMAGKLHEIPRKFDKLLPKFDPDKPGSLEDHVNNFFLAIHLLGVEHDGSSVGYFLTLFLGNPLLGISAYLSGLLQIGIVFKGSL